jgi:hypothetical protein
MQGLSALRIRQKREREAILGRSALSRLAWRKTVRCVEVGGGTPCDGRSKRKNRNRYVAQCFVNGADLAAEIVLNGYACDCERFSAGRYSNGRDRSTMHKFFLVHYRVSDPSSVKSTGTYGDGQKQDEGWLFQ